MEKTTITEDVFQTIQGNPKTKLKAEGFANDVNALVSLIEKSMASKPVCSIVTPVFSAEEKREFLAHLSPNDWTTSFVVQKFENRRYSFPYLLVRTCNYSQDVRARSMAA